MLQPIRATAPTPVRHRAAGSRDRSPATDIEPVPLFFASFNHMPFEEANSADSHVPRSSAEEKGSLENLIGLRFRDGDQAVRVAQIAASNAQKKQREGPNPQAAPLSGAASKPA